MTATPTVDRSATDQTIVGEGVPSFQFLTTTATVRHFRTPQDVIALIDDDLESGVAVVQSGGTTFLSPILGRLGGIVALDGTLRSHLAIVSREFEVPCLVGASLTIDLADGTRIRLDHVDAGSATISTVPSENSSSSSESNSAPATTADDHVTDRWWSYVRRVGDDIAVKDYDVDLAPGDLDELLRKRSPTTVSTTSCSTWAGRSSRR